jgi:hypothetical protein
MINIAMKGTRWWAVKKVSAQNPNVINGLYVGVTPKGSEEDIAFEFSDLEAFNVREITVEHVPSIAETSRKLEQGTIYFPWKIIDWCSPELLEGLKALLKAEKE